MLQLPTLYLNNSSTHYFNDDWNWDHHAAQNERTYIRGVARGGGEPPRNLADQWTLFKPGGQIMPLTLLPAPPPRIQKAIYISA